MSRIILFLRIFEIGSRGFREWERWEGWFVINRSAVTGLAPGLPLDSNHTTTIDRSFHADWNVLLDRFAMATGLVSVARAKIDFFGNLWKPLIRVWKMQICINLKSTQFEIKKRESRFINLFIPCNNLCILFVKGNSFYFEMFLVLVITNEYIPFFVISLGYIYPREMEGRKATMQRLLLISGPVVVDRSNPVFIT